VSARLPGTRLRALAECLVDQTTLERVVLPALADLQHECAMSARVVVRLRAYWGCLRLLTWFSLRSIAVDAGYVFPMVVRRTGTLFVTLTGFLILAPFVAEFQKIARTDAGIPAALIAGVLLLPQALFLAWPVAHFIGIATSDPPATPVDRRRTHVGVIVTSLGCVLLMFVIANVVTPAANQGYRVLLFSILTDTYHDSRPVVLSKGLAEMTWSELNDQIRNPRSARQGLDTRIHRQIRLALCLSPLVFGLLALRLAGRWRSRLLCWSAPIALLLVYWGFLATGESLARSPAQFVSAIWLGNVVFFLAAVSPSFGIARRASAT
jgi:lipopolysaccharide export LptBFGC system permease protein LptF